MEDIIVVRQLPIIEERLKALGEQVQEKTLKALSMLCSEETVKTLKAMRAELNRERREIEQEYKRVENEILAPVNQLRATLRQHITDRYNSTDLQLKERIEDVENGLKEQKKSEIVAFFDEYLSTSDIDFLTFEDSGIVVTMSASKKSLKDQCRAFIDKVSDDLNLIKLQPYGPEILVEYRRSLNASQAVTTVTNRHKAIEEESNRFQQMQEAAAAKSSAAQKVDAVIQAEQPAVCIEQPLEAPVVEQAEESEADIEEVYQLQFSVTGTLEKLKALKAFLVQGGYEYEQL